MARRSKQQYLLGEALAGSWKVSAIYVVALAFLTFVVIPLVTNPILRIFAITLRPAGLILIGIFSLIAIVKLIKQSSTNQYTHHANWRDSHFPLGEISQNWEKSISKNRDDGLRECPVEWSLNLIRDIEWKKFEELSTAYYQEKGIRAEATSLGADGGIDIKLYQGETGTPSAIVQCKAWNSRQVGVKQIREFLGVMTHEKIAKGFYMTSGEYSDDAKEVAKANRITLINGEMMLIMIKRLPEESQERLLALATDGDYTTPTCPSCGIKMVKRSGRRGEFWGCKNFPRCRQMLHFSPHSTQ